MMAAGTRSARPAVTQRQWGNYTLKSMKMGKTFTARAFLTGARSLSGTVAETEAGTPDEALDALQATLAERDTGRRSGRRRLDPPGVDVPATEEYADALASVDGSPAQRTILRAHALAGGEGLDAGGLADAGGYKSANSAQQQYALYAKRLAEYLKIALPAKPQAGEDLTLYALAAPDFDRSNGTAIWVMHPELAAAVEAAI
jgi:hypothetical protein